MHRCSSAFRLTLAVSFIMTLTGCLGKNSGNSNNGGVSSVTLSPAGNVSIDVGTTLGFGATGKNAGGGTVLGVDIQYIVESATPSSAPLSVASSGNACAGTWDASFDICSPGTPGIAYVRAVINGITSSVTTVYVHQHVDSVKIVNGEQNQPPYQYSCFPQGQTWQYEANAYSDIGGQVVDISNTVGPMTWSSSNTGVVTTTPLFTVSPTNPGSSVNFVQTTAKAPGITELTASISGTASNPFPYTTCLIKAIYLQIAGQNQAGNSITVNNGSSISVKAIAIDTLYGIADSAPLAAPPLTWTTTNPEVASFSTVTNTTGTNSATARNNLGGAMLSASCTPPSCNIGLPGVSPSGVIVPSLPIYASDCNATTLPPCPLPSGTNGYSAISVDVTSTSTTPTYTAWAATTDCQNALGCSSALFSVTQGTKPIGTILSLPRTPNSMMFNHLASPRVYLGSDQGLMYVDVSSSSPAVDVVSNATTPCNVTLCGKVLTISNDGSLVVVSDTISNPSQVYIYNGSSTGAIPVDLKIPGETATAAAFSPDQLKLFILTNTGSMYIYSTVDALTSVPIATSVTDVKFSGDGSFAYIAGAPGPTSVTGYATCDSPTTDVLSGVPITTTYPTLPPLPTSPPFALYPLPTQQLDSAGNWAETLLALDPPNVDTFAVKELPTPLLTQNQYVCIPPSIELDTDLPKTSVSLGQGNFSPLYAQLVADGTEFIVVATNVHAVLLFDVNNGTTTSVPLFGGANPLSASASTDGSQVFVAACDQYDQDGTTCAVGSIHIINTGIGNFTTGQGDFQQVPYVNGSNDNDRNMCNNGGNPAPQCLPNLVAIRPQ
jgi:hypothetical protein